MTCTELQARLQAYAGGTMSAKEEAAFEAHLSRCEDCATLVELAEPELRQTGGLPNAVAPAHDLWPAIQDRIASRKLQGRMLLPKWALAAAAVLLVAVSSGITAVLLQRPSGPTAQRSARLAGFEAEYAAASEDLTAALAEARNRLAPETVETIERNLNVINTALLESHTALAGDPGNVALEQLVVVAWRQKVDLLRRAIALPGAI